MTDTAGENATLGSVRPRVAASDDRPGTARSELAVPPGVVSDAGVEHDGQLPASYFRSIDLRLWLIALLVGAIAWLLLFKLI